MKYIRRITSRYFYVEGYGETSNKGEAQKTIVQGIFSPMAYWQF